MRRREARDIDDRDVIGSNLLQVELNASCYVAAWSHIPLEPIASCYRGGVRLAKNDDSPAASRCSSRGQGMSSAPTLMWASDRRRYEIANLFRWSRTHLAIVAVWVHIPLEPNE